MKSVRTNKVIIKLFGTALIILSILIIVITLSIIVCSFHIKATYYSVPMDGIDNPFRIVIVADTHGKVFGNENKPLFQKISDQKPDIIVLLGDLFPSEFEESDKYDVISFTKRMQDIAPVFFVMGNHEWDYTTVYGDDWINLIRNTGAIVLEEECMDFSLKGNTIRFGSSVGHGFLFGRSIEEFIASPEFSTLSTLETSPYPSILLAHMPDTIALEDAPQWWHIDLALCAHTHGGVIRIPGKGGIYVPLQGWWPPYDHGEYKLNDQMRMIITSGLSGYGHIPRIFNLPEICVVDIIPSNKN